MPNPWAIPINLDAELGEAIKNLIARQGYGESTYFVKEYMEKHREELIKFWNGQGKDGQEIYDKWYSKWSMTKPQQDAKKKQKERANIENKKRSYIALGYSEDRAEELAEQFPKKNPTDVVKIMSYAQQSQRANDKTKSVDDKKKLTDLHKRVIKIDQEIKDFKSLTNSLAKQKVEKLKLEKIEIESEIKKLKDD